MFRSLIVGCGKIAGIFDEDRKSPVMSHAHAYRDNGGIKVAAYIDNDPGKARKLAAKYGPGDCGSDLREALLEHRPDVVSVCTPDRTHAGIVKDILKSGFVPKVIFVEKPVCSDRKELDLIKRLSSGRDVRILVNHTRRFDDAHRRLKGMIRRGKFGKLVRGDVFYYGGWRHNGVHVVDTLLFLFGGTLRVKGVCGAVKTAYSHDPTLEAVLSLGPGEVPVYLHAFDEKYYQVYDIDFKFDRSRLRIEDFGAKYLYAKKTVNHMKENVLLDSRLWLDRPSGTPMQNAVKAIVSYLRTGDRNMVDDYGIDKAGKTMEVIWEAEKMKRGKL